ncbi:MAG: PAS domain S-box protein, partial [Desertifilum sp. SIO1I2]|nr:PAS domain S-box protein [Desertifilum sp. SIO1I2]
SMHVNQQSSALSPLELKVQTFFELSEDLCCILGSNGEFKALNSAWTDCLGWQPEELRSQTWLALVDPQDILPSQTALEGCVNQKRYPLQNRYRHKDSTYHLCQWRFSATPDGDIYAIGKLATTSPALETQVKLYHQALEATTCGITIADLYKPDYPIIYCNRAFEQITGYSQAEVLGQNCRFLQTPDTDPVAVEQIRICLREGISCKVILKNQRKDGSIFWNELSISPVRNAQGTITHYIGVQTDITHRQLVEATLQKSNEALAMRVETRTTALRKLNQRLLTELVGRKRAEAALQESEARLRAIFERATIGICRLDLRGQILESNPVMQQMLGYSQEALQFREFTDFLHPDDVRAEQTIYEDLADAEIERYERELQLFRSDGKGLWTHLTVSLVKDDCGEPSFAIAMIKDIAERRTAESALRLTRSMLDGAAVAAFLVSADGRILYVNETAALSLGYRRSELLRLRIHDIAPDFQPEVWTEHWGMLKEFGSLCLDSQHQTKEEKIIPVELTENYLLFQGQEYVCIFALDITEHQRAEAEARRALLREKELNDLRSRFITTISHQYRAPLTAIHSSAEGLGQYGHQWPVEKRELHVRRIQVAVNQMTQLLDDVLTLGAIESRKIPFQPIPVNLGEFCQQLCEELKGDRELQRSHPENEAYPYPVLPPIRFTQAGDPTAVIDRHLLRHILANLLTNALKYSPLGEEVHFHLACEDDFAIFTIQDSGLGIPEADQPHIFELFHRGSNVGSLPGTGLGLSIVKKAIEIHGGEIEFTSEVGVGTTAIATLPLS